MRRHSNRKARSHPFAAFSQAVLTPHYAGATQGAVARVMQMGLANVQAVLAGRLPVVGLLTS
jgi:phosphoglycerate dehydrogenase-like enzyme